MNLNTLSSGTILQGSSYNYRIQKVLGQGSFGITYLASIEIKGSLGTINSNTVVAIKEFFMKDINGREKTVVTCGSKGGLYEDYKRKFIREAKNLSKLDHPNIVKVLESFETNNTAYYVMEYIDGGNLNEYIEQHNGLSEAESIKYFKEIASALSYMHSHKMLHLDMKPSNVMLRKNGEIILIDFGLSKQYDENGTPESSTTVGGGTPGYAPIEQSNYHEGKDFPVTMDVYALGATLFKMLTGVRPPEASVILNNGFPSNELVKKHISKKTIDCIERAMKSIKKHRFQNIGAFIDAFNKYRMPTGKIEDTIFEEHSHRYSTPTIKHNWLLGGFVVFFEILFALIMKYNSHLGGPFSGLDSDGFFCAVLYPFITLLILIFLIKNRSSIRIERWNIYKWTITTICILNSLLLPMWNYSLTASYFLLSCGLSIVSGYTFSIKTTVKV